MLWFSVSLGCPCWCLWSENQTLTFKISRCCIHGWLTPNRILSDRKCLNVTFAGKDEHWENSPRAEKWPFSASMLLEVRIGSQLGWLVLQIHPYGNSHQLKSRVCIHLSPLPLRKGTPDSVTAQGLWHSRLHRCMVLEIEGTLAIDHLSIGFL